jgi:O-antigen ligase
MTAMPTLARRRAARPSAAQAFAAAAAAAGGLAVGVAVTVDVKVGLALALAAVAAPLALIDVPVAAAAWVGLGLLSGLAPFGLATTAVGLLLLAAWLVRLPAERARAAAALRLHRGLLAWAGLLLLWLALSIGWARDPGAAALELARWSMAAVALVILLTVVRTERDIRLIVVALIAGTLVSVLVGLAAGGLGAPETSLDTATSTQGRLQGGSGDPNFLASYIVPVAVLAAAVRPLLPAVGRAVVPGAIVVLVVGLGATQSRGGTLAAIAALLAAVVLMRGRRLWVLATIALVTCAAVAYFAAMPSAIDRLTSSSDGGNGREDLWRVAGRMFADHPVAGVGLDNFRVRSSGYVREPGSLQFVDLIAERPHEVHNTYLQILAENGVVGLLLLVAFVLAALASARRAARRFQARGAVALAQIARAVLVADVALLVAALFLSFGSRPTFWVLLALGPLLLGVASTSRNPYRGAGSRAAPG